MKFSTLFTATAVTGIVLVSCSKVKLTAPTPVVDDKDKIVSVFKFDGNVNDSNGVAIFNNTVGTPSFVNDRKGNANSAIWLDGATKMIYSNFPIKGQSLTMMAWVKAQPAAGLRHFVVALDPGKGGPSLFKIGQKMGASVSVSNTNSAESNEVDDNWHHLAMTYDGKDIKVYVDGVFQAATNHPGSMGTTSRELVIGAFKDSFFRGTLDDIRVYENVWSAEKISQVAAQ